MAQYLIRERNNDALIAVLFISSHGKAQVGSTLHRLWLPSNGLGHALTTPSRTYLGASGKPHLSLLERYDQQRPTQDQLDTVADIAEKIHAEISKWQSDMDGKISEQCRQIIVAAVSAIVYDPHPGWRLPSGLEPWPTLEEALTEVQRDAISKIGPVLEQIAAKSPDGKTANAFEMLHSFHGILKTWCPFRKE